jgi:4-hydroxybenzoate polyprenyltransferase
MPVTRPAVTVIRAVGRFARFHTIVLVYLHMVFFGLCLRPEAIPSIPRALAALVAMTACYVNATAVNDLSDEVVDRLNLAGDPDRPLVTGLATRAQVRLIATLAGAVTVAAAACAAPWLAPVAAVMVGLNVIYSVPPVRVAGRGAIAQALLPLEYCAFPAALTAGVIGPGHVGADYVAVTASLWAIFTGRLFIKDLRDEAGDRATGKLTYTVRHGAGRAIAQSAAWTVLGTVALSLVMFLRYDANAAFVFGFCAVSLTGQLVALRQCARATALPVRILYTGVYGRWISLKIFFYIVLMGLALSDVGLPRELAVLGLTALFVGSNVAMLYENIGRLLRPLAPVPGDGS